MKKKNLIYIALILLTVLTLGVIFISPIRQTVVGSTTLALTQVDLRSSYAPLDGKVWVYTFSQGGLGQYAVGTVDSEDASDRYSGDESPEEDFEMRVTYDKQECQYPIKLDSVSTPYFNGQIYSSLRLVEFTGINVNACIKPDKCGADEPMMYYYEVPLRCNVVCGTRRTGNIGRLENPSINSQFTVNVQADGDSDSETFQTLGETKGAVGSHTYVTWDGNFNTGKQCQDKDPYIPIYRSGSWYLGSSNDYDTYSDLMDDLIANADNDKDVEFLLPQVNSASSKALNRITLGSIDNAGSQSSGLWTLDIKDQDLIRPVVTAFIEADWIGIVTPIGKPRIESAKATDFKAGSNGNVKVIVKNIGDDIGTFNIYGECSDSRVNIYENKEVSVGAGKKTTVYLPISGDVSSDTRFTCNAIAQGTQFKDEKTFGFEITVAGTECTPRDMTCMPNGDIYECNSEGFWSNNPTEECGNGCEYDEYGQPFCTGLPPPPPPPAQDISKYIPYLIGAVLGLSVFGVWYGKIKPKGKQKPDYVLIGIILLISAGLGFFSYILSKLFIDFIFSWWGLLTGIIMSGVFVLFKKIRII